MKKKLQNLYLKDYNLLKAQALWKAHCQILSIILLYGFIKLNVETVICVALNTQTLKMINRVQMFMLHKNNEKKFNGNLKRRLVNKSKFANHDINTFILLLQKGVC